MWDTSGINLKMCEGDFGLELPITVSGDYKVDVYKLTPPSGMVLFG